MPAKPPVEQPVSGDGAVLGIDIGTSAVKALIMGHDGHVRGVATATLGLSTPRPGWSEQNPEDWWSGTLEALGRLRRADPGGWRQVTTIGLSGQMHGAVLLDARHRPVRPAILWNDGRSMAECAALEAAAPGLGDVAGVRAMPGFTAPKIMWIRQHEPSVAVRIAHLLLPKDYVRLRLSGVLATDMSDAAGTLWLDQKARSWSAPLVAASGIDPALLPPLHEGPDVTGPVLHEVAAQLALPSGVQVVAGAGDAAAGAIGIGAIDEGDAFLSLGTSAQMFVATQRYRPRPETMVHAYCHALPGRWYQMAAMLNGAVCLQWLARQLSEGDVEALVDLVARETSGPGDLMFLPYLAGERTPHNDPDARGAFIGLGLETTPAALARAVLDGVAYSCADARDSLQAAGTAIRSLGVIGGGARSDVWMTIIASMLGVPLTRYRDAELGPAFGAARLALIAAGCGSAEDVCVKPDVEDVTHPDPALAAAYAARLPHFRDLYGRLRGAFLPPG